MSEWQPIKTASKSATGLWLYEGETSRKTWRGKWIEDLGWVFTLVSDSGDTTIIVKLNPTHWMPLPEPPQEAGNDESAL